MYVSLNLNVDKVHSNYGGANHRQGEWMEKLSAVRTSLVSPSKVTFSYTTGSCTFTTRVRDLPLKLDITVEKEVDIQWEKKDLTMETQEDKNP